MKKGIPIVYQKSKKTCHRTTFYFFINMSSCRKLEIQNDLPKITKIMWISFFLTNSGQKSLTMLIWLLFNNYSIDFLKIKKLKK